MSKSAQQGAPDPGTAVTRAAETDRMQVAQLLTDAAAQGRLQMSDYEDRLTRAYAAKTYDELDELRSDLLGSSVNPQRGGATKPAPSMLLLILFRAVQGLGAGAIMPTSITVAGDIYTVAERAKEAFSPNWNFRHISQDVLPMLRERGVTDEQLTTMLVDNPRRYFAG